MPPESLLQFQAALTVEDEALNAWTEASASVVCASPGDELRVGMAGLSEVLLAWPDKLSCFE